MSANAPTKSTHICNLLCELERSPMTTRGLADRLGTTIAVIRARLAELRSLGVVSVVATKPQGAYALKLWGIAP
jgi:predicted ArsR family transcriptional regulator